MSHSDVIGPWKGSEVKEDEKLFTWAKFGMRRWLLRDFRSNLIFFSNDSL